MDWAGRFAASSAANAIPASNLFGRLMSFLLSTPLVTVQGYYQISGSTAKPIDSAVFKLRADSQPDEIPPHNTFCTCVRDPHGQGAQRAIGTAAGASDGGA